MTGREGGWEKGGKEGGREGGASNVQFIGNPSLLSAVAGGYGNEGAPKNPYDSQTVPSGKNNNNQPTCITQHITNTNHNS